MQKVWMSSYFLKWIKEQLFGFLRIALEVFIPYKIWKPCSRKLKFSSHKYLANINTYLTTEMIK